MRAWVNARLNRWRILKLLLRDTRWGIVSLLEERNYYLFALSAVHQLALLRADAVVTRLTQAALNGEALGSPEVSAVLHRSLFPPPTLGLGLLGRRGWDQVAEEVRSTGEVFFNAEAMARGLVESVAKYYSDPDMFGL